MKKIILIMVWCFCMISAGYAQVTQCELDKAQQEMKDAKGRKEKKAKKEAYNALLHTAMIQNAFQALEDQQFVLEAERINFRKGAWKHVTGNTNFISVEGDQGVIQISIEDAPVAGPNGIGGITLDGPISNVETRKDKKGNIHFSMNVTGKYASATVNMTVSKNSHKVLAVVSPNLQPYSFTMEGYLVPASQTKVYKARVL